MNLPSASPNENMKTDSAINPMPARRAERSSAPVEIFARKFMCGYLREATQASRLSGNRKTFSRHSGMRHLAQAWNDGGWLPPPDRCDTDVTNLPQEKQPWPSSIPPRIAWGRNNGGAR